MSFCTCSSDSLSIWVWGVLDMPVQHFPIIFTRLTPMAHFESNYSSHYSNYNLIRTSIVATIVLLEINGGPEHRSSSRLSGSLL